VIRVSGLRHSFGSVTAVADLSFGVTAGEAVGLLGPNGSGKTTVIRLLLGLLRPDGGTLRVAGSDPLTDGSRVRALSGVLTETAGFYGHLSGAANLRFFAGLYGVTEPARVDRLIGLFGLAGAAGRTVDTYSTGMLKRLGLARALLHRPAVLFLDEPTNGLDPEGTRQVLASLRRLREQEGTTILICSHLLGQLEAVCDRYVFIRRGALLAEGSLPELRRRFQPGITLEVLTSGGLSGNLEGIPVESRCSTSLAGKALQRFSFTLPQAADVPGFLARLADDVPLYGARVVEDTLEDIYFRVQEPES